MEIEPYLLGSCLGRTAFKKGVGRFLSKHYLPLCQPTRNSRPTGQTPEDPGTGTAPLLSGQVPTLFRKVRIFGNIKTEAAERQRRGELPRPVGIPAAKQQHAKCFAVANERQKLPSGKLFAKPKEPPRLRDMEAAKAEGGATHNRELVSWPFFGQTQTRRPARRCGTD